ncbi:hypothetical protein MAPG_09310 [Magnaporthiopsis poae ATCC 64411]|uniref:protein-ribulosamine 3-kinase n=1 Tax=Magnaporthiopsis poae (strain ATCC 64411 / 73-15) TaxID=644358 RepID=A0A0C4E9L5_MAGP6|nr:hypothetical protein MAPG_09310 [Magnaporthiopsis poae ATCC 64411]
MEVPQQEHGVDLSKRLEFTGPGTQLDPAVLRELPEGCKVVSVDSHGTSFWATTGRIDVILKEGGGQSFFIKVIPGEVGWRMVSGEFESMTAVYRVVPEFVPKPLVWSTYGAVPDAHFFLCEFRDMLDDMPDPHKFGSLLAKLHRDSTSPTGKFGFHATTYAGNLPQFVGWEDSWEVFFTKSMRHALDLEIERRGTTEELESLSKVLFDKVIPRLLRPLESDGRSVKPSLVHGDLWYANAGIDKESGQSLVFDACCFYAHNESQVCIWKACMGTPTGVGGFPCT